MSRTMENTRPDMVIWSYLIVLFRIVTQSLVRCTRWFLPLLLLPLPTAPPYFLVLFLLTLALHARPWSVSIRNTALTPLTHEISAFTA
ncbi:hypothetical protein J3R83DRAFT_6994 [Lanmaoa asiatica]|nr:hypothetical protein J3R83DRAFT_6994 [Lanmaoa asiatica]